ncbi:MAG TPA: glutathione S-transferase family protein [Polyangiaceae bacterium]|nr:glutathione S-transferase family protein [Polyangiaceae bacterium]
MQLIGQYDSPFVRRVAIALTLYELPFEHLPLSVWADAEELAKSNPLRRVPTLVLDTGECLIESFAILDALDEMVGPRRALIAAAGVERRNALRICALATGSADKAVSLFYEKLLRPEPSEKWLSRCRAQIGDALSLLNRERERIATSYWFGESLNHADIAVACALRFINDALPGAFDMRRFPALARHSAQCEALPVFQAIAQPFEVMLSR